MKRQNDHDEDVPFDVDTPAPAVPNAPVPAPKDILSASKVEAVRFHPAKPGYAYDQVETFVDAVIRTLRYLEQRMYQDDLAIHEAEQENELLNEQIATLKATIEVFRANGDPVRSADGGFATASTLEDQTDLRAERDELAAALAASQTEVAELRAYIDEQLAPWIAEQEADSADEQSPTLDPEVPVAEEPNVMPDSSIVPVHDEPSDPIVPEPSDLRPSASENEVDEKAVFAATAAAFAAVADADESDDWEDDTTPASVADVDFEDDEDLWEVPTPSAETDKSAGPQFSTPEIEALGVSIDPKKVIKTDDAPYERVSPPKAGTPLPRLLPPEIAAMMESDQDN